MTKSAEKWRRIMAADQGALELYMELYLQIMTPEVIAEFVTQQECINVSTGNLAIFELHHVCDEILHLVLGNNSSNWPGNSAFRINPLSKIKVELPQLRARLAAVCAKPEFAAIVPTLEPEKYKKYWPKDVSERGTDLRAPYSIISDNLTTMKTIANCGFKWSEDFADSADDVYCLLARLQEVAPNHEAQIPGTAKTIFTNPQGFTWLQLLAQAPFLYIEDQNDSGKIPRHIAFQLTKDDLIAPEDIAAIKAGKIRKQNCNLYQRHGGCPANHRQFRERDQINRFGKMQLEVLKQLYLAQDRELPHVHVRDHSMLDLD